MPNLDFPNVIAVTFKLYYILGMASWRFSMVAS